MENSLQNQHYLVLARKYRPQKFEDMIGQDALVRTIENAIEAGRIHHAYVLTGIRGTGKTTTARILAKALNCENGPSITWDDDDAQCQAIADGKHVDVLEFDAASHTGVDDIRDLFEGVNYAPVQGRYKVYIIDEVHMLSKQAFNALLKTLEEPPEHVKFIFATTEVNKIPVTVLSRCQRIDTKRVTSTQLATYFHKLLELEKVEADEAAVTMIGRAADGSVRDGLSLLDQAIALSAGKIETQVVQDMLGLSDRALVFDLLDVLMAGDAPKALEVFGKMYGSGYDPLLVMQDVLQSLHMLTRIKIIADLKNSVELSEIERTRGVPLAEKLSLEGLSRAYQMMLQAVDEAKKAERPHEAVEMAIIRTTHLASIPALATLLQQQGGVGDVGGKKQQSPAKVRPAVAPQAAKPVSVPQQPTVQPQTPKEQAIAQVAAQEAASNPFSNWRELVRAVRKQDDVLGSMLEQQCTAVRFAHGEVDVHIESGLYSAREIHSKFADILRQMTGEIWQLNLVDKPEGVETVHQTKKREHAEALETARNHPEVKQLLNMLPPAEVVDISIPE